MQLNEVHMKASAYRERKFTPINSQGSVETESIFIQTNIVSFIILQFSWENCFIFLQVFYFMVQRKMMMLKQFHSIAK